MLTEALTTLAAAGGTAVVKAAGTDAWEGVQGRAARLLGRGDAQREHTERERLDQTAAALAAAYPPGALPSPEAERLRARHEVTWQARFEVLLETLDGSAQAQAAGELLALIRDAGGGA